MKKIVIGSDKSGFPLKEALKEYLLSKGYEVEDVGMKNLENFQAYYQVAPKLARLIQSGAYEKGVLVCGTGAGMAVVANKFKGVYAAAVESSYTAKMATVVNQANVLTMGGWVLAPQQGVDLLEHWLNAKFTEGFPVDRQKFLENAFQEVKNIEETNFQTEDPAVEMTAFCGIDCSKCSAYLATIQDSQQLRESTAREWSAMFHSDIKPEDIHCLGCQSREEPLFSNCKVCSIRLCGIGGGPEFVDQKHGQGSLQGLTCAECTSYSCEKLTALLQYLPKEKVKMDARHQEFLKK